MNFLLWLFILSGFAIIMFLVVKVMQEKFLFNFPWYTKRQEFEKKLSAATTKSIHFMEVANAAMFIDMIYGGIGRLKDAFFHHRRVVKEKATAMSRRMIAGDEESEKKPSEFLNDISSFKDRFREK